MLVGMNEGGLPVYADGSPAQGCLLDGQAFLHVMPRLWLPYRKLLSENPEEVHIESLVIPELQWRLTNDAIACRPYPNWKYVAFRSNGKLGFYVPLPDAIPDQLTVDAEYYIDGDFRTTTAGYVMQVYHRQVLNLTKSEVGINCYSTEKAMPTVICEDQYERVFKELHENNVSSIGHPIYDENVYCVDEWYIDTQETLNPLPNRYVLASEFDTYTPHHAKQHASHLEAFHSEHMANARIRMPESVFGQAIRTLDRLGLNYELPEQHLTMQTLCDWWNHNTDVPEYARCAASCKVLVRFRNEDEYQDVDINVPVVPITAMSDQLDSTATAGDHLLIVFMRGQSNVIEDNNGSHYFTVDGGVYETIGAAKDEFPVGADTLSGLYNMSTTFPLVYEHIVAAATEHDD